MSLTPLVVFEELRFVLELMFGNFLFLLPFARNKRRTFLITLLGTLALCIFVLMRIPLLERQDFIPLNILMYIVVCIYIITTLGALAISLFQFSLTLCDAIFLSIAGYSVQHLVYVIVHEAIVGIVWPGLADHLMLYILFSIGTCLLIYIPTYITFSPKLRRCNGQMMADTPNNIVLNIVLLVAMIHLSFYCQDIYEFAEDRRLQGVILGGAISILFLSVLYEMLSAVRFSQDRAVTEQMLRDAEQHYAYSRELIDYVNRSVHDLKHTLKGLEQSENQEKQRFLQETNAAIQDYQKLVYSENEVLNTILAEKALLCDKKGISFSVSMGKVDLSFLSTPDLYVLLGNAIDNAIEGADLLEEAEKRAVNITFQNRGGSIIIQTNNYYKGTLRMEGDMPLTSKKERFGHGYGLKSIRILAEKYGGSVSVAARDQVFILIILLPLAS